MVLNLKACLVDGEPGSRGEYMEAEQLKRS